MGTKRVPQKGVVRFWAQTNFGGLQVARGVVLRTAKSNLPIIRSHPKKSLLAPPRLDRTPYVLLRHSNEYDCWVSLRELHTKRKDVVEIVEDAARMVYAARTGSTVDPLW